MVLDKYLLVSISVVCTQNYSVLLVGRYVEMAIQYT